MALIWGFPSGRSMVFAVVWGAGLILLSCTASIQVEGKGKEEGAPSGNQGSKEKGEDKSGSGGTREGSARTHSDANDGGDEACNKSESRCEEETDEESPLTTLEVNVNGPVVLDDLQRSVSLGDAYVKVSHDSIGAGDLEICFSSLPDHGILELTDAGAPLTQGECLSLQRWEAGNVRYVYQGDEVGSSATKMDQVSFYVSLPSGDASDSRVLGVQVHNPCYDQQGTSDHTKLGSGAREDPYLICTATQLQSLGGDSSSWEAAFKLRSDIDLSAYQGEEFNVIGNDTTPFRGFFDGNNHTVDNFTFNSASRDYVGLFGYVDGTGQNAEDVGVRNIQVSNLNVSGRQIVGGLVGHIYRGHVYNVQVQGEIYNSTNTDIYSQAVGGVIGRLTMGRAAYLSFFGNVTIEAGGPAGGVVGVSQQGSYGTALAFLSGHVEAIANGPGNSKIGGVMGQVEGGFFDEIYSLGDVTNPYTGGGNHTGGIIGYMGGIASQLKRSFVAEATISAGTGASSTGFIGGSDNNNVGQSYYGSDVTCTAASSNPCGTTNLTEVDLTADPSYFYDARHEPMASWRFAASWREREDDYPAFAPSYLADGWEGCSENLSATPFAGGVGSPTKPYLICTVDQLLAMASDADYYDGSHSFELRADLDLAGISNFAPIGLGGAVSFYFDGKGHTIRNLTINRPSTNKVGLFSYGEGYEATSVHNLRVMDADVTGSYKVGILFGAQMTTDTPSSYSNIVITGQVTGGSVVGGLMGQSGYQYVARDIVADVTVVGSGNRVGGLYGYQDFGVKVWHSYVTGSVTGASDVGGLAGDNRGKVDNVFVRVDVTNSTETASTTGPVYGPDNTSSAYFDSAKVCSFCSNSDGQAIDTNSTPDYFYDKSNAPHNAWDFERIWKASGSSEPVLRLFDD